MGKHGYAYRVENPGGTIPGRGIEDGPQVEEEHGRNTTATEAVTLVVLGLRDLDVCADDPKTDGATRSTDQQQVTATDLVNKPEQPDEGHDCLHDTEYTRGEQTCVGTLDTNLQMWLAWVDRRNVNNLPT